MEISWDKSIEVSEPGMSLALHPNVQGETAAVEEEKTRQCRCNQLCLRTQKGLTFLSLDTIVVPGDKMLMPVVGIKVYLKLFELQSNISRNNMSVILLSPVGDCLHM